MGGHAPSRQLAGQLVIAIAGAPSCRASHNANLRRQFLTSSILAIEGQENRFADVGSQSKFSGVSAEWAGITHYFKYEKSDRLKSFLATVEVEAGT